jgi:uncharacterized membrane protein
MSKSRLEAFSDGVLAIIITIMVLELKAPREATPEALTPLIPSGLSYLLSFVFVGIYWNNHHHLLHAARRIDGRVLWANLHLLFWLSLIPVATSWMGQTGFAPWPVAAYGAVLFLAAVAYAVLTRTLIASRHLPASSPRSRSRSSNHACPAPSTPWSPPCGSSRTAGLRPC